MSTTPKKKSLKSRSNSKIEDVGAKKKRKSIYSSLSPLSKKLRKQGSLQKNTLDNFISPLKRPSSENFKNKKEDASLKPNRALRSQKEVSSKCHQGSPVKLKIKPFTRTEKKIRKQDSQESIELPTFKKKSTKSKEKSKLFETYGVILPTHEEILQEKKRLIDYKNKMKMLNKLQKQSYQVHILKEHDLLKSNQFDDKFSCKHLHKSDIKRYFLNNIVLLTKLGKEIKDSNTYEAFNKEGSLLLFTEDQIFFMLDLLQGVFKKKYEAEYIFKVLLPELCQKIISSEYDTEEINLY